MKTIALNGHTYHCPFSAAIPRHDAETAARMDENDEFVYPVLLYRDVALGLDGCVLDGEGRLESAARTGAALDYRHLGDMTTEQARELVERIENDRRHETPEAIRRRRDERVKRVAERRAAGESIRTIAEAEGVSIGQVQRDIKSASGAGVSPDTPAEVTGRDGKTYPATTPRKPDPEAEDDAPVGGEAWEPDDGSTDFDPDAEAEPDVMPGPHPPADPGEPRKNLPKHFKPGNHGDPDHPFAKVLNTLSHVSGLLTSAMNEPGGEKLKAYLLGLKLCVPRALIVGDKHHGWYFTGLRGLRRVVRLAGLPGRPKTAADVQAAYTGDEDDE